MPSFSDTSGDQWQVRVTLGAVQRCRDIASVDLLTVVGGEGFAEFIADPVKAASALYAVVKPEADRRGIGLDAFLDRLSGDAIQCARDALMDAIVDFFPSPAERRARRNLLNEVRRVIDAEMRKLEDEMTPERIRSLIESGEVPSNLPESQESTRTD
jgi:hypothetical protein